MAWPERTITVNGFSKTYLHDRLARGLGRWARADHARGSAAQASSQCVRAVGIAVRRTRGVAGSAGCSPGEYLEQYSRRRRIVLDTLDRLGFTYGQPRGGFYVFLNAGSSGYPAEQLSRKLLTEAHVLIFPGTGFGPNWSQYMRLASACARGTDR